MSDITITLHDPNSGSSESIPVSTSLTVKEVLELGSALLNINNSNDLVVTKYGKTLNTNKTLSDEGVTNGDLLALLNTITMVNAASASSSSTTTTSGTSTGGLLDFSNLLAGESGTNNGNTASTNAAAASSNSNQIPFYYAGMSFAEAAEANPHPKAIVKLLQTHSHLFKEFNYHMPVLAKKLEHQPYEMAVELWREDVVKNSLRGATAVSQTYHKEKDFKQRLTQNPNDTAAKDYFERKDRQHLVNQQYQQAMQEYPESMGRVLMLYIEAKINNKPVQAFVDRYETRRTFFYF